MAKIHKKHIYPVKPNPAMSDYLIGTNDLSRNKLTMSFEIGRIASLILDQFGNTSSNIVVSGKIIWLEGLKYEVTNLSYFLNSQFSTSDPVIITLTPAHPLYGRIDTVVVDMFGNVSVIDGLPSPNPAKADVNTSEYLEVGFITLDAGQVTAEGAVEHIVYNENVEWATNIGEYNQGGVNFEDTSDPYSDEKSIGIANPTQNKEAIYFTNEVPVSTTEFTLLHFYIKLDQPWILELGQITLSISDGANTFYLPVTHGNYGLNLDDYENYQSIVVPLEDFNSTLTGINRIGVTFSRSQGTILIDKVRFVGSSSNQPIFNTFLSLSDTPDSYYGHENKVLVVRANGTGVDFAEMDNLVITKEIFADTDKASLAAAINALPSFSLTFNNILVVTNTNEVTVDITTTTTVQKIVLKNKGKGNYGVGGVVLTEDDIEILSQTSNGTTDYTLSPETQFIELGEIGATAIEVAFNAHEFTEDETPVQSQEDGYVIVNTTIDGEPKQFLFVGSGGNYGTTGTDDALSVDFVGLDPEEEEITLPDVWRVRNSTSLATGFNQWIQHGGNVNISGTIYTPRISSTDGVAGGQLHIQGNYGAYFAATNPNHGSYQFRNGAPTTSYTNKTFLNLVSSRNATMKAGSVNVKAYGISVIDYVNFNNSTGAYAAIYIDPTIEKATTPTYYAIQSKVGNISVEGSGYGVYAKGLTTAQIDAAGSSILPTKEWILAQGFSTGTTVPSLEAVTGVGNTTNVGITITANAGLSVSNGSAHAKVQLSSGTVRGYLSLKNEGETNSVSLYNRPGRTHTNSFYLPIRPDNDSYNLTTSATDGKNTINADSNGILNLSTLALGITVSDSKVDRVYTNEDANGTIDLDLGAYETFKLTLTAAVILTVSNPPAAGKSKTFTMHVTGSYGIILPSGWDTIEIKGDTYDGAKMNILIFEYVGPTHVIVTIENRTI